MTIKPIADSYVRLNDKIAHGFESGKNFSIRCSIYTVHIYNFIINYSVSLEN